MVIILSYILDAILYKDKKKTTKLAVVRQLLFHKNLIALRKNRVETKGNNESVREIIVSNIFLNIWVLKMLINFS